MAIDGRRCGGSKKMMEQFRFWLPHLAGSLLKTYKEVWPRKPPAVQTLLIFGNGFLAFHVDSSWPVLNLCNYSAQPALTHQIQPPEAQTSEAFMHAGLQC